MSDAPTQRSGLWGRTPASRRRREAILKAGKTMFFRSGYQLASVEEIAAAAGTTKRTVYDHFGSKEKLFSEVMVYASRQFVDLLPAPATLPESPADGLRAFAARLSQCFDMPEIVRFQRLVIAEAERRPELARSLADMALAGAERTLVAYLEACVAAGRLRRHDLEASARMILDLAANSARLRGLFGLGAGSADSVGKRALDQAIELLTERWAPSGAESAGRMHN